MTNLVTAHDIEKTEAYNSLEGFKKKLIVKRANLIILETALIHYNKTGIILPKIGSNNLKILKEIINES